jgi:hypothetical protein
MARHFGGPFASERPKPLPLTTVLLIGAAALAVAGLVWVNLKAAAARRAARAGYFSAAAAILHDVTRRIEPSGFARMAGTWRGHRFDLQAVPDTLTFRKLPSLWVMITLTEPMPVAATLHIMSRPGQSDVFSRFGDMAHSIALPPGFPEQCALRCDDAARLPPQDLVAAQGRLFADPLVKELVISPKGLRLVVLAEEAERGRYLLFRDAEMGSLPFPAARLSLYLDALVALRQDLSATKEASHG